MPLPLLLSGALAVGIALAVGLTFGTDQPAANLTLEMPDLPPLPPRATPDSEPPVTPAGSTPATTATAAPTKPAAPSGPRPARTSVPPTTQQPKPSPTRSSGPSRRPETDVLQLGSRGAEVEDLQRRLQQLRLYLGPADGIFTTSVMEAVSRFQRSRAIPQEHGAYGPLTRAVLRAETGRNYRSGRDDDWRRADWDY
ncbi:peptidoglycan-binding protein [Streptomyces sp. NPDC004667]|uniref:peptidoglycan-binding domain-containing protein n=1 Tax=Streptomyces sp. NPDC004667 TaxID=3154285 RepID=UPI0033A20684